MSDKEFLDLEVQVKNLIKLSKQLKESNIHLLKKNKELSIKEQKLSETLTQLQQKILKDSLKISKKRRSNLNGKEYYKSKNFRGRNIKFHAPPKKVIR